MVIGASMSGLLAARVLADRFAQVTVLDRDLLPDPAQARKGVPQGRHPHVLLCRGRKILERLFPGLNDAAFAAGAVTGDILGQARWYVGGGRLCRTTAGVGGLLLSRPQLETLVRRRVLALPNVRFWENTDARGYTWDADSRCVTGVRVVRRSLGEAEETLTANLVVDCTGRGSRSAVWLEGAGYPKPAVEELKIEKGYTARIYRRRPEDLDGDVAVVVPPTCPPWRGGALIAVEDDRWIVGLAGYLGDQPPKDEAGFLEFVRSVPAPELHELLSCAEPLSDFLTHHYPASRRCRYDRLPRFPEGCLVMGDALMSLNPIYGQGMTLAALTAEALEQALAGGTNGLAARYFRAAHRALDGPWQTVIANDLRHPDVVGPRPAAWRFFSAYVDRVQRAAHRSPAAAIALLKVSEIMEPPTSLLRPAILLRALWLGGKSETAKG